MGIFNKKDNAEFDAKKGVELKRIDGMRYLAGFDDKDRANKKTGFKEEWKAMVQYQSGLNDSDDYYKAHIVFFEKKVEFRSQTGHNPEFDISVDEIGHIKVENELTETFLIIELKTGQEVVFTTPRLFALELRAILFKTIRSYGL